jgi:integrase
MGESVGRRSSTKLTTASRLWPFQPLAITALHTGFRASELFSPTWEDVDCRRWEITVQAAHVKNSESRSVPMNEVLTATLQTVRMSASAMAQCFGPVRVSHTGHFA